MSTDAAEAPAKEYSATTKELGDKIAGLTLKEAKELSDYLKDEYGIEPAAGGGVVMAAPTGGDDAAGAGPAAQTEFDVVMESFGDNKIAVIKELRAITGLGLKEAKALAEEKGGKVKEKVSAEEAEDVKKKLEAVGATISVK